MLHEADSALGRLTPHEELLLRLRFGIGGRKQPLAAIATHFGLQPEDVRQLESRALTRLRRNAVQPALEIGG